MKIKITQAGSESFNGWIGDVEFVNGVSVTDQPEQAIAHVGAIYSIELVEDVQAEAEVEAEVEVKVTEEVKTAEVKTPEPTVEKTEAAAPTETAEEEGANATTDADVKG